MTNKKLARKCQPSYNETIFRYFDIGWSRDDRTIPPLPAKGYGTKDGDDANVKAKAQAYANKASDKSKLTLSLN